MIIWADKRCEKNQIGYCAHVEQGCEADRWGYAIVTPEGVETCNGARLGKEADVVAALRKMLARLNKDHGRLQGKQRRQLVINTQHTAALYETRR